jgi:hypothetical protein
MVQAAAEWWIDRRSMSRAALVDYLTAMISTGIEGLFGDAIADATPNARNALRLIDEPHDGEAG